MPVPASPATLADSDTANRRISALEEQIKQVAVNPGLFTFVGGKDGGVVGGAFREAVRLDPKNAGAHAHLSQELSSGTDPASPPTTNLPPLPRFCSLFSSR
jgi:hypothetical protein